MDGFFTEKTDVTKKPTKKRKVEKEAVDESLKQKARLYCKCPEQWKIVSRYNAQRLKEFVDEREFQQQSELHNTVFNFAQRVLGLTLDLCMNGKGYIQTEIENDISLRAAIEIEAANWVAYLSNRWKILALTGVDITNGKMNQRKNEPTEVFEINGSYDTAGFMATELDEQKTTHTMPEQALGDDLFSEAEHNTLSGEEGLGEVVHDCEPPVRPDGVEVPV